MDAEVSRQSPRRILVVKLASLGDMLVATPALRALRSSFPAAHIAVLATPSTVGVLKGVDSVDEIIPFDKFAFDTPAQAVTGLPGALELAGELRGGNWDALVLLHHLTTPFGVAKYAGLVMSSGARMRVGADNGRGWFLTHRAEDRGFGWKHEADYWLSVVGAMGATHPGEPRLELVLSSDDVRWGEEHVLSAGQTLLLVPGSGRFSLARRWSPERFAEVGRAARERWGLKPMVLAGLDEDEQRLADRVALEIGGDVGILPAAPSAQALGAAIQRCALVVANDSGPVHVAAAVGTPVVAIFGPMNHEAWRPYPASDPRNQVARDQVVCSPCIHRGHEFGTPEGCAARTCLAILESSGVLEAAERALAAGRRSDVGVLV